MNSVCELSPSGKHDGYKDGDGWECSLCERRLVAPCEAGLCDHTPARRETCVMCDCDVIRCDYCGAVETVAGRLPEGWLSCRIRVDAKEGEELPTLAKGPTACPACLPKLRLCLK